MAFKDELTTVVPLRAESTTPGQKPVFSYLTIPKQAKLKFLHEKALAKGLNKHQINCFNRDGHITLESGETLLLDDFTAEPQPSKSWLALFLPDETYLESYMDENSDIFDKLREDYKWQDTNAAAKMHLIYHSVADACMSSKKYSLFDQFPTSYHIVDSVGTNYPEHPRLPTYEYHMMVK